MIELYLCYSARVSKMATRLSGHQVEKGGEQGTERGGPVPPSEPTPDVMGPVDAAGVQSAAAAVDPARSLSAGSPGLEEADREKSGALGVSGGQPDVPPSGPNINNELPEPKVTILFELGTRHELCAFASYFQFRVKSDILRIKINFI